MYSNMPEHTDANETIGSATLKQTARKSGEMPFCKEAQINYRCGAMTYNANVSSRARSAKLNVR